MADTQPQMFNIPGITLTGLIPRAAPLLLVISGPKVGKSSLATTLFDYPNKGDQPLVLAFDASGPDSCAQLGYQVQALRVKELPGARYLDKAKRCIDLVEQVVVNPGFKPSSIVFDCVSTACERILSDEARFSRNPDQRAHYKVALDFIRDTMNRLVDLQIPIVMLSWMQESFTEEESLPGGQKRKKTVMGGPLISGRQARGQVAGKADLILILEKLKVGVGAQGADQTGYARQIRTRTWEGIECGGRYVLPDPSPAHLGYLLAMMTGKIPNPALQAQPAGAK